ncbi:uncharacterized protein PAS_chr4_0318 [Komagataella phaffii GS115]|uniref:Transporter, member of a family of seven S. cerevisiae genes (AVT1-7) n=1 Tax=Komagataella phaffii (strain GS115 / ATCC 20864) TaxID=644223 RepID=C4R7I6_KOMPG|nr:uncharacterized protein PAS_chr4_0318 [Komagataella phaffii GS115]AOA70266.1 GQ68_04628T0 [Komagataella phaffii GS115]CAY71561.1 Putative transporter, member of a family of seven S. cerevisiae genes (AVT1-7) [Komagataella phaffii GS115]
MSTSKYQNLPQVSSELDQPHGDPSDSFEIEEAIDDSEELELEGIMTQKGKSNMGNAFMNMANSILGAGIIGQPYAFRNCGMVGALLIMVLLTILVDWTIRLVIINTKLSGTHSYQGSVYHCFGNKGKYVILLAQGLFAYGGSMAFCVIIGDTIPHVIRSVFKSAIQSNRFLDFLLSRNSIIILTTCFISYPLALNRDISKLSKASGLALVSMLVIVIIVLARGPVVSSELKGSMSLKNWFFDIGMFQGISVISFALVCHHNTTFIYRSMKKATLDRFTQLTHISCAIAMVCCSIMGIAGFAIFKDKTKGNILNNFPADDWVVNIARFCFGFNMLTTFPLEIFVVRDIVKDVMNGSDAEKLSTKSHFIITTLLSFSAMFVSLLTCNLGAILELTGATSASIMAYILPPLCYAKMSPNRKGLLNWYAPYLCVAFGLSVMVISTIQTLVTSFYNKSDAGHCVT